MSKDYIKCFSKLHTDAVPGRWPTTTRHRAPHKPLLLLAVIDLIAEGHIRSNLIELTPDLGELFTIYWARVMPPDQRGNLAYPFFHLKSEGFWDLVAQAGKESILANTRQIRSINHLRDIIVGAQIDDDLFDLLCDQSHRDCLRLVLIETYFASEMRFSLLEQGVVNAEAYEYSKLLLEQVRKTYAEGTVGVESKYRKAARDQGFRLAIIGAYTHRCALCGIRILTPDGHTAVDAAHIIPWSISQNDDPRNGMALCRLCHWSFDEGMIGISYGYLLVASRQLNIDGNLPGHLTTLIGRPIIRPTDEALWPDVGALTWHLKKVFRRR